MARKLRIEYPGAIYHVMHRGDWREPIFRDHADHSALSKLSPGSFFVASMPSLLKFHFHRHRLATQRSRTLIQSNADVLFIVTGFVVSRLAVLVPIGQQSSPGGHNFRRASSGSMMSSPLKKCA
jgi:hypothetical protein